MVSKIFGFSFGPHNISLSYPLSIFGKFYTCICLLKAISKGPKKVLCFHFSNFVFISLDKCGKLLSNSMIVQF